MSDEQPTWLARISSDDEGANIGQRMSQFASGETRACPICQAAAERLYCWHGIEYVVLYVKPCGCRLGCWEDAPAWARAAGIVDDDRSLFEDEEDEPTEEELQELQDWYINYEAQERAGQKPLPGFVDNNEHENS